MEAIMNKFGFLNQSTAGRITKMIASNLFKIVTLLIAVSIVAFTLVSLSPVDPVQQYLTGVPDVSE